MSLLIGRDDKVSLILDDIKDNPKASTWLITGESGIGKSALLDEIYERLQDADSNNNKAFVGYYSKDQSLISESLPIYPFNIALSSLIKGAKDAQNIEERANITINRLKKVFVEFAKEEGVKIVEAILEDVAKKAGLEETIKVGKGFWSRFKSQKSSIMLTEDFVSTYKEEVLTSYIDVFKALVQEFKERQFVLIFDQFEHVGKASIDFLLNFIKLMPKERIHIIISFRTDDRIWNDPSYRKMYEDIQSKLIDEMNGKEVLLQGLTAQDIGIWIEMVRQISLPLTPDLQRIRERSAGLPLILDEWIKTSETLNYEEISYKKPCKQILKLQDGLTEDQRQKLKMLSVLLYPLKYKILASYLKIDDMSSTADLFRRIQESRIFIERNDEFTGKKYRWFRHELLQRCFYDEMDDEEKEYFHDKAATFFIDLKKEQERKRHSTQIENEESLKTNKEYESTSNAVDVENMDNYTVTVSAAYHLHMSKKSPEESFRRNRDIADHASKIGNLDLAERCYKMALKDIEQIRYQYDETNRQNIISDGMWCLNDLAVNVYYIWGRYGDALSNYQSVLEYSKGNKNKVMESRVLHNIAMIHSSKGEYDRAVEMYDQSLKIKKKIGDQKGIASTLNNMAMIHYNKGEYDQALEMCNQSLKIANEMGEQQGIALTLNNIALIHSSKGEYDRAVEMYDQSLKIQEKMGEQPGIASTLNNMAMIHHNKGEYDRAVEMYDQSLKIAKDLGDQDGIANTLNNIALIHSNKGEYDQALELYDQSLKIAKDLGDQDRISNTLNNIAWIHRNKGEYEDTLYHVLPACEILQRLKTPELQRSLGIISDIKAKLGIEEFNKLKEKVTRRSGNLG